MALTPGSRLGVYEVIAPIGEGGMGQVYRARDTKLNRDVALCERLYAPLTAGILEPYSPDDRLASERTTRLDRLYRALGTALDELADAVGLKAA